MNLAERHAFGMGNAATAKREEGRGKRAAKKQPAIKINHAKRAITVGIGIGIPCLSLYLSHMGGSKLAGGQLTMGVASLALCSIVLAVSLSHLAWAVKDITRSKEWQSWAIAIVTDCTLILCELGGGSWMVMATITAVSAVLNCYAFLRHK